MPETVEEDGRTIELQDSSQMTAPDLFLETDACLRILLVLEPGLTPYYELLLSVFKEVIHFGYAIPGQHDKPSAMLVEAVLSEVAEKKLAASCLTCNA